MEKIIISCGECKAKLRVPLNKGLIQVRCPKCNQTFIYDSGNEVKSRKDYKKVEEFSKNIQKQAPETGRESDNKIRKENTTIKNNEAERKDNGNYQQPKKEQWITNEKKEASASATVDDVDAAKREVRFVYYTERVGTSLDKLENAFAKNFKLKLYVDGKQVGIMENKVPCSFQISTGEHRLWASLTNAPLLTNLGFRIPAGSENYLVFINKMGSKYELCGGPRPDPFLNGLQEFIKGMFQKRGIRERILMVENRTNKVELSFHESYMQIFWQLENPKGFQQWSTGGDSEKIYYFEAGLIPPTNMPPEYWVYVRYVIAELINTFDEYSCSPTGIVSLKKVHDLY